MRWCVVPRSPKRMMPIMSDLKKTEWKIAEKNAEATAEGKLAGDMTSPWNDEFSHDTQC
ncbi:MAG: hypothetical protein LM517_10625 [Nitrosomonas sp.]|nr:hypothetical protein [Nitrosomonas sp.]